MVERKPDAAEAIFSTINILCVPSKKGEDHPLKFSLYIHPKIVKEYADGLSPKNIRERLKNQFCFLMKVSRLAPLLSYLLTHKLKDEHIYQINYG